MPPAQEQPAAGGRSGRGQDRDRRGPRPAHRRVQRAGDPQALPRLRARHGRAPRRHQVPRRFRAAAESRAEAARGQPERDPVHRRDSHADRGGRRLGRHARCVEPPEARAAERQPEVHRRDHLPGIPRRVREGSRALAPLPEDRRGRALGAGDDTHPEGPEVALRGAPRREVPAVGALRGGRALRALHQRPAPARQGDRRDRRGGRRAEDPAEGAPEAHHRQARDRGHHRQDRAHPAADGVERRPRRAEEPGPRPEGDGVRPGQGDRRARRGDQDGAKRPGQSRRSRSAASCSRAPPASARPRSRASSPIPWASS